MKILYQSHIVSIVRRSKQKESGEELSDVTADLVYATTGSNKVVDTLITDATGQYAFDDYLPGAYQIQLTKLPLYAAVYNVTISENTTIDENLSVNYIPINVSGAVINSETNQNAANATITFSVDTTVVNNTAIAGTATSSKTGHYAIYLNPGTYNVSVRETVNVSGTFGTYVFSSTLVVAPGEEHKSLDIMLTKIE